MPPFSSQSIESLLQLRLPEELGEALSDGELLCRLANRLRPRLVPFIHVPSPAAVSDPPTKKHTPPLQNTPLNPPLFVNPPQPKLSTANSRRNVESFLEACRRLGVPEVLCLGRGGAFFAGQGVSCAPHPHTLMWDPLPGEAAPSPASPPWAPRWLCPLLRPRHGVALHGLSRSLRLLRGGAPPTPGEPPHPWGEPPDLPQPPGAAPPGLTPCSPCALMLGKLRQG